MLAKEVWKESGLKLPIWTYQQNDFIDILWKLRGTEELIGRYLQPLHGVFGTTEIWLSMMGVASLPKPLLRKHPTTQRNLDRVVHPLLHRSDKTLRIGHGGALQASVGSR